MRAPLKRYYLRSIVPLLVYTLLVAAGHGLADGIASPALRTALVLTPLLYSFYATVFVAVFAGEDVAHGALMWAACWVGLLWLGWVSVLLWEVGMDSIKYMGSVLSHRAHHHSPILRSLTPLWLSMTASQSQLITLRNKRRQLQRDIVSLVEEFGPKVSAYSLLSLSVGVHALTAK